MATIEEIGAREILDSRGNPTVEVELRLDDGTFSRSAFGKEVVKMFGRKDPGLSPCPIRPGLPHVPFHLPVCRVAPTTEPL